MNKAELVGAVQKSLDDSKAGAERAVNAVIDAIKKGDQVVTTSGLHAEVVAIRDHEVDLMAGSSRFTYSRAAVNEILD